MKDGWIQAFPLPTEEVLSHHYAQKYYQSPAGTNYQTSYSEAEALHRKSKFSLIFESLKQLNVNNEPNANNMSALDIGCGEGFFLTELFGRGYKITGLDYDEFACKKFNPEMLPFFQRGDINENLNQLVSQKQLFNLIYLGNVLEHVQDPQKLLEKVKSLLAETGVCVILVPNDFTHLQKDLLRDELVKEAYFFAPPEHLNYFNTSNLQNFLTSQQFKILDMWTDFPVEWYLPNSESNYVANSDLGKAAHNARVYIEAKINENSEAALNLWRALCGVEHGRAITVIVRS
jgi:2-polyprenyl-3-methyl-5-hydroxy-6-metoxy-1,4-benzoquinol methylase